MVYMRNVVYFTYIMYTCRIVYAHMYILVSPFAE